MQLHPYAGLGRVERMANWIAIYGSVAIVAAVAAAILAGVKRRDYSFWAACTLLFPPLIVVLFLLPKNMGARPVRVPLDADDNYRD